MLPYAVIRPHTCYDFSVWQKKFLHDGQYWWRLVNVLQNALKVCTEYVYIIRQMYNVMWKFKAYTMISWNHGFIFEYHPTKLIIYRKLSLFYIPTPQGTMGGGWGCEVSCGGHHRPRGKTTTGSVLDGAVFDIAQILAYLVHNMSRSQLYLGFGHFGWLPSFFGQ